MAVELSVSLSDAVAARATRVAEGAGIPLSTWLAQAVKAAAELAEVRAVAELAEALAAVQEYEAMFGEPDPDEVAKVDAQLAEAGVGLPEPPEARAERMKAYCPVAWVAGA